MRYVIKKSLIKVLGRLWMPQSPATQTIPITNHDIENLRDDDGKITRDSVDHWIRTHVGDFSSITDFSADIEDGDNNVLIPWANEENEMEYFDCINPDPFD